MDLSPIKVDEIKFGDLLLLPEEDILIDPYLSDRGQIGFEYEPWAISCFASSRENLIEKIGSVIVHVWEHFITKDIKNLSDNDISIRDRLLSDFRVINIHTTE